MSERCHHCGYSHEDWPCPRIVAVDYGDKGRVKRVEYDPDFYRKIKLDTGGYNVRPNGSAGTMEHTK